MSSQVEHRLREFLKGRGWTSLHEARAAGVGDGDQLIRAVRVMEAEGAVETMGGDKGTFMVRLSGQEGRA